jgi:ATP-dependent DNA helicase RecQ
MSNITPDDILLQYWGYTAFRPLQRDIIGSVLSGNDTLALMPTGGGKSICYQVPALMSEGLCLVISPLIALMKDQLAGLQAKEIKAAAVYSGMSYREIDIALDNAIYGGYRFLLVSPERLTTDLFRARLPNMNINLLAVDEAHCISQWGYDFRPSYLKIAEIREYLPRTPVLALTASATPRVQADIREKLGFKIGKAETYIKSFDRQNIIYAVLKEENKNGRLLELVRDVKGSALIYARTRKAVREAAGFLQKNGENADFYHAGLTAVERNEKQESWKSGRCRIMACTNAFGMGIDKADVRLVVHYEIPDNLEAYYQEAGRAGRDERRAFAIAFYNEHDRLEMNRLAETSYPTHDDLVQTYHAVSNYLQIPEGAAN